MKSTPSISAEHGVHVVRDQEDGRLPGPSQPGDEADDFGLTSEVEAGQGLVEEQQARVRKQGLGHEHALLFPAGKLPERGLGQIEGADLLQDLVDRGLPLLAGQPRSPAMPIQAEADHVPRADGDPRVQVPELRNVADPTVPSSGRSGRRRKCFPSSAD